MTTTTTTTSADGTRIALEVIGDGPPVVLIGGMFCTRATHAALAAALADAGLRVATYDRRGRGGSDEVGPTPPPADAVRREVEDLDAVVAAVGGDVALYGHSSGACLAFRAVTAGLAVRRLVLHEPPWSDDDRAGAIALHQAVCAAIDEGRPGDAIAAFLGDAGLPADAVTAMATDPSMLAVAPTMPYDLAATGVDGSIPAAALADLAVPTLVLAGTASPPFFLETAEQVAQLVPGARLVALEGADHGAGPDVTGPAIAEFLAQ